jgi:hypothetical protein
LAGYRLAAEARRNRVVARLRRRLYAPEVLNLLVGHLLRLLLSCGVAVAAAALTRALRAQPS